MSSESGSGSGSGKAVAKLGDVPEGFGLAVEVEGRPVALFNDGGRIFALEDICTHARIPISGGWVERGCARCPWHGAEFDLKTGWALSAPAAGRVAAYVVRVEGDEVFVDVSEDVGGGKVEKREAG